MPRNTVAVSPQIPTKSLWVFYQYSKLHCWRSSKTSRTIPHLEPPQLPVPDNTPQNWLQLRETAHLWLSATRGETQRCPKRWLRTPKLNLYTEFPPEDTLVSAEHREGEQPGLWTRPLLSPTFSFPKETPLTHALAAPLLTTTPSN